MPKPTFFKSAEEFAGWLERNHHKADELWVGYHRKATGRPGLTYPESVDVALCYGWIDGVRKSVRQIHGEIRDLQTKELEQTSWGRWLRWYALVPRFLRLLFFRMAARAPGTLKGFNGTVLVSSVGMFGSRAGWGIPLPGHTLSVTIGGIETKPVLFGGELRNREHLCLTVTFRS